MTTATKTYCQHCLRIENRYGCNGHDTIAVDQIQRGGTVRVDMCENAVREMSEHTDMFRIIGRLKDEYQVRHTR